MIVDLSEIAKNVMMDALSKMMDGGRIEILSEDRRKLAELKLSRPATKSSQDGEIEFNKIQEEDAAVALGNAAWARVFDNGGAEIFTCDVGDGQSNAVIKLNTQAIFPGGPVRIKSFRLVMP